MWWAALDVGPAEHRRVTEGRPLPPAWPRLPGRRSARADDAHTATATAGRRLDQQRQVGSGDRRRVEVAEHRHACGRQLLGVDFDPIIAVIADGGGPIQTSPASMTACARSRRSPRGSRSRGGWHPHRPPVCGDDQLAAQVSLSRRWSRAGARPSAWRTCARRHRGRVHRDRPVIPMARQVANTRHAISPLVGDGDRSDLPFGRGGDCSSSHIPAHVRKRRSRRRRETSPLWIVDRHMPSTERVSRGSITLSSWYAAQECRDRFLLDLRLDHGARIPASASSSTIAAGLGGCARHDRR